MDLISQILLKGLSTGNANQPVSGGFEVDELYAEVVYRHIQCLSSQLLQDIQITVFGNTTKLGMVLTLLMA